MGEGFPAGVVLEPPPGQMSVQPADRTHERTAGSNGTGKRRSKGRARGPPGRPSEHTAPLTFPELTNSSSSRDGLALSQGSLGGFEAPLRFPLSA